MIYLIPSHKLVCSVPNCPCPNSHVFCMNCSSSFYLNSCLLCFLLWSTCTCMTLKDLSKLVTAWSSHVRPFSNFPYLGIKIHILYFGICRSIPGLPQTRELNQQRFIVSVLEVWDQGWQGWPLLRLGGTTWSRALPTREPPASLMSLFSLIFRIVVLLFVSDKCPLLIRTALLLDRGPF